MVKKDFITTYPFGVIKLIKQIMGEEQIPIGLGKMFVCSIEDLSKKPMPLEKLIKIEPGMLTYKEDDEKPSYSKKGFNIGFDATIDDPNEELVKLVERKNRWDVMLQQKPGRMPRKMKKAYLSNYPRNTKWKSRVKRLLSSICHHFPDAEVVITQDHFDSLASLIEVTIKK